MLGQYQLMCLSYRTTLPSQFSAKIAWIYHDQSFQPTGFGLNAALFYNRGYLILFLPMYYSVLYPCPHLWLYCRQGYEKMIQTIYFIFQLNWFNFRLHSGRILPMRWYHACNHKKNYHQYRTYLSCNILHNILFCLHIFSAISAYLLAA